MSYLYYSSVGCDAANRRSTAHLCHWRNKQRPLTLSGITQAPLPEGLPEGRRPHQVRPDPFEARAQLEDRRVGPHPPAVISVRPAASLSLMKARRWTRKNCINHGGYRVVHLAGSAASNPAVARLTLTFAVTLNRGRERGTSSVGRRTEPLTATLLETSTPHGLEPHCVFVEQFGMSGMEIFGSIAARPRSATRGKGGGG